MPVAWFICPYEVVVDGAGEQYRRCAVRRFAGQIAADGGNTAEAEILGDHGIVKVRASLATLTTLDAEPGFQRVPRRAALTEPLSDLSAAEKTAIRNKLLALGYSAGELQAALGNDLGAVTLGDLLHFAASRWRRPLAIVAGVTVFEAIDYSHPPRRLENIDDAVS